LRQKFERPGGRELQLSTEPDNGFYKIRRKELQLSPSAEQKGTVQPRGGFLRSYLQERRISNLGKISARLRLGNATMRIQLELPEEDVKELKQLMKDAHIDTYKELFANALTLVYWVVKEVRAGRTIASINEQDGKYKELAMPMLRKLKPSLEVASSNKYSA
jgi:hypothetical protein